MTSTSPRPSRVQYTHHSHLGAELTAPVTMISPKNSRVINKVSSLQAPPPLLGPLEDIFQLLQELFHSRKSLSLSKGVVRALFTIYQNLKVIRVHAIVQTQFANDLKIRLVDLKRQLEAARTQQSRPNATKGQDLATATPEPALKKVFPVLEQTEKVVSTLHKFLVSKPRLRLSVPPAICKLLARMPEDLVRFPDHLARQLSECKTLLQRIVVLYNQLSEAHKSLAKSDTTTAAATANRTTKHSKVPSVVHVQEPSSSASEHHDEKTAAATRTEATTALAETMINV